MRKIIYSQMVSLDDYVEGPNGDLDWSKPGEKLHRHFNEMEKNLAINFYGRRMSEAMDFWLTADQIPDLKDYEYEYARLWKNTHRMVFSKTLTKVKGNARIIREVDPEKIYELKKRPGGNMVVGGADLASTFIKYRLIDEYRLYKHPVVLGRGKPMFPKGLHQRLLLAESQTFDCGVQLLVYKIN